MPTEVLGGLLQKSGKAPVPWTSGGALGRWRVKALFIRLSSALPIAGSLQPTSVGRKILA
jgi:hypothetical protein